MTAVVTDPLGLLDWRRRVAALYADVRRVWPDDPYAAHAMWCETRDDLFATHPQTPLRGDTVARFTGLDVHDYNPDLVFEAVIDRDVDHDRFPVGTSTGATVDFVRIGRVALALGELDVLWLDAYGGGLFLPFRDATSGDTTYGGGRYLLDTVKGADLGSTEQGELILDFNFSYHPSCHYASEWSCPLAPPDNRLDAAVDAGERSLR